MNSNFFARERISDGAGVNLILFTYAGGSPSLFAPWKRFIHENINVFPVLYPGRELRRNEQIPNSVQELVKELVDSNLQVFQQDFVLFGHCTGNIIAYETARYVYERIGIMPKGIIVSASDSPVSAVSNRILFDEQGQEVSDEVLAERMVEIGIVGKDFTKDQNFINYYMPIYRGDLRMLSSFHDDELFQLDCPFLIMRGSEDDYISKEGQDDWKRYTKQTVRYECLKGGHFYFNDDREGTIRFINDFIEGMK